MIRGFLTQYIRFRLHGKRALAVAAHDQGVFPFGIKITDHLADGDIGGVHRRPHLHIIQVIGTESLIVRWPRHDGQQLAAVAVQPHGTATEVERQGIIQILAANPGSAGLGFKKLRPDHLFLLAPIMANAFQRTVVGHDGLGLEPQITQYFRIRAAEARFDGRRRARPNHQALHLGEGLQVFLTDQITGGRQGRINTLPIFHLNNQLGIAGITLFWRIRQHEPRCPLANGAGHLGDAVHLQQRRFQLTHRLTGGANITALGQPVIHQIHGRIGRREEGLLDETKTQHRHHQQHKHA